MVQRASLVPRAKSEIGAPCPDIFQENFQNGRPKTNFRFQSFSKVTSKKASVTFHHVHTRTKLYTPGVEFRFDLRESKFCVTVVFTT